MNQRPVDPARRALDRFERTTGDLLEVGLRSPLVLDPAGTALSVLTQAKRVGDRLLAHCWRFVGLPTKGDQDRALHALNELQSKLLDLEELLREREEPRR